MPFKSGHPRAYLRMLEEEDRKVDELEELFGDAFPEPMRVWERPKRFYAYAEPPVVRYIPAKQDHTPLILGLAFLSLGLLALAILGWSRR